MLGALIYLRVMSFRNWVLWRVRRLRQPKYLIGALVGAAYFYLFFFRRVGRPGMGSRQALQAAQALPTSVPFDWVPVALAIGAVGLLVMISFTWIVPTQRAALGFSEAEIAFLFPAPVTRRALVHFRLISAQLRSLMAALIMALVSNRWTLFGGSALTHALGWWFIFSALNLHFTGAGFTLTRLADRGVNLIVRRGLIFVLLVAIVVVTFWRLPAAARVPSAEASGPGFSEWVVGVAGMAPLSWVLFPLRLVLGPFFAADLGAFVHALWPALLVLGLHYVWVVNSVVSFEEASIAQAERRAARIAAWRSGEGFRRGQAARARPGPFRLAGVGRPEVAFLWKNLLSTWPYFNVRVFGIAALVIVAASVWVHATPKFAPFGFAAGWMALFAGAYALVLGPQFARQDIRGDLRKLDLLKTYPLAGWQIVLGEVLTPAAILTGLVWLAVLVFVLNAEARGASAWLTPGIRAAAGVGLAALVPPLALLQVLVPNAAALLFPSWFEATRTRGGGPEVMGQRMIFLFAQLLTIVLVLLPAAAVGAVIVVLARLVVPLPVAIVIAAIPVALVLFGEVAALLWWVGARFEKVDVAEELRA